MKKYNAHDDRRGDRGLTQLGSGYVDKINPLVKFLGKLSTAQSFTGLAMANCNGRLGIIQALSFTANTLGMAMSQIHLARKNAPTQANAKNTDVKTSNILVNKSQINLLEDLILEWQVDREVQIAPNQFIFAITPTAAFCAVVRDILRECEVLSYECSVAQGIQIALNRLSDLLDLLVRHCYVKKI